VTGVIVDGGGPLPLCSKASLLHRFVLKREGVHGLATNKKPFFLENVRPAILFFDALFLIVSRTCFAC